ncbi:MAG: GHKL domain-containing protein [Bacilli bacterium]|nr:GHKL domain-containing protein [Bacilli bacterium]
MSADVILYGLATIVGYLNLSWIYGITTNQKFNLKLRKVLIVVFLAIVSTIVSFKINVIAKTFYNLFAYFIMTKLFYNNDKKKLVYYTLLIWLIGGLFDVVSMSIVSAIIMLFYKKVTAIITVIATFILQIFLNLLFRIKYIRILSDKLYNKIEQIENIVWFYIVIVALFFLFGILAYFNIDNFTNGIMILFFIVLCLSISIYFVHTISIEKIYNETSKNLLENNSFFVDQNTKNRIFKHNIIHKLDGVKSVANDKSKKLLDDLIEEYNLTSSPSKEVDNLPNGINGLICQKIYSNKSKKVDFAINNYIKSELFDVLTPKKYNKLCETLGICLDNAITATLKTKEKILQIAILENQDNIFIKIVNTFKSELEIDEIGNLNYTTKTSGHGLGLYSIFSRKDVMVKTSIINNLFENQIIVKKNKIKA